MRSVSKLESSGCSARASSGRTARTPMWGVSSFIPATLPFSFLTLATPQETDIPPPQHPGTLRLRHLRNHPIWYALSLFSSQVQTEPWSEHDEPHAQRADLLPRSPLRLTRCARGYRNS